MSLTDDWKAGKIEDGYYYFRLPSGNIEIASEYKLIRYNLSKDADKIEVLAPVPSYEELQRLKSENAELIEANDSLTRQVKHLLDLQKEEDKEVESLRELLKECKNIVKHDLWSRAQFPDGQVVEKDDILTRINAAIGESEE